MKIIIENTPANYQEFNAILEDILKSKENNQSIEDTYSDLIDLRSSWNHIFGFNDTIISREINQILVSNKHMSNRIMLVEF